MIIALYENKVFTGYADIDYPNEYQVASGEGIVKVYRPRTVVTPLRTYREVQEHPILGNVPIFDLAL